MLKVFVLSLPPSVLTAMSQPFLILNFKNAFHAPMDVSLARPVTIVLNAGQITFLTPRVDFVSKFAVMERNTLQIVMMEIM